jgi:hypothetical protein
MYDVLSPASNIDWCGKDYLIHLVLPGSLDLRVEIFGHSQSYLRLTTTVRQNQKTQINLIFLNHGPDRNPSTNRRDHLDQRIIRFLK